MNILAGDLGEIIDNYSTVSGDMLALDNVRLLHGRMGYQGDQEVRHLEGGYWDWDIVRSRRRVLQAKLANLS